MTIEEIREKATLKMSPSRATTFAGYVECLVHGPKGPRYALGLIDEAMVNSLIDLHLYATSDEGGWMTDGAYWVSMEEQLKGNAWRDVTARIKKDLNY